MFTLKIAKKKMPTKKFPNTKMAKSIIILPDKIVYYVYF